MYAGNDAAGIERGDPHTRGEAQLGDILSGAVMCVETTSEKIKKGLFGGNEIIYQGAVLTKGLLVWAAGGTKASIGILSARLNQITVQDYAKSDFAKLVPDSGVQVHGLYTDTAEAGSAFIGLEENAAGRKFREVLIAAVQA